ncbi:MAG: hypothetical protein AM326_05230 [Candidatus Thorarchaeota archaeon SMTZ-45]|nr:MAG: hypothetical protein AM325_13420 [Candidatus Thorarchaeota archaeon SMTZ1-45]KXH77339.1 MAG: hypothetical protein AM326_05230 [Candidatus Thorarchaeota archaeon SMTZ-45]
MESNQERQEIIKKGSFSEGCVVFLVAFTILVGFWGFSSSDLFTFVTALGLSSIAIAILHLARVLQNNE